MKQLQDRVAIVTGASSGIGKGIAETFAAEGARVVLAARGRDKLEAVAADIKKAGGTALVVPTDITMEDEVINLFQQTQQTYGQLDILINNAGMSLGTPADELSLADWRRVIDLNLTAAFLCSREALRMMKPQGRGRIINIGSVSAKVPRAFSVPYSASKAGLEGMTRALALEGREHGISVSILSPGNTMTAFWEKTEALAEVEGAMSPSDVARMAVTMAAMPDDVLVLESIMLPLKMPFLGRG